MSEDNEEVDVSCCCAACGIAEIDDIKLVPCDGCDLVRYCSDACREDHKADHEEACKKRAAELRDELLFKQPESTHMGDCPICSLPLPFDQQKSILKGCCSKFICSGCAVATAIREMEMRLERYCPFCREPAPENERRARKLLMKRVKANDPVAISQEGAFRHDKGDYRKSFDYSTKAAELGDVESHFRLAILYHHGKGAEKDEGKETHHLTEAAIGGHPEARHHLGNNEWQSGNFERAVKHWTISAALGFDESIKNLLEAFKEQKEVYVSKEDLDAALRAHKAAVDATKSPQRKKAEEYRRFRQEFYQNNGLIDD